MLSLLALWAVLSCALMVVIICWRPATEWAERVTSEANLADNVSVASEGRILCAFLLPAAVVLLLLDGFGEEGRDIIRGVWEVAAYGRSTD
jgi:hypothetical protein